MDKKIYIKAGYKRLSIPLEDIIFMEKEKRKIIIHMRDKKIVFYGKFSDVEIYLDERFVHPHRSFILNMDYILRLGLSEIVLEGGAKICFGKKCFAKCAKAFDSYVLKRVANAGFL